MTFPKYQLPELQKDAGLALQKEGVTAFVLNKATVKRNGAVVWKLCPLHSALSLWGMLVLEYISVQCGGVARPPYTNKTPGWDRLALPGPLRALTPRTSSLFYNAFSKHFLIKCIWKLDLCYHCLWVFVSVPTSQAALPRTQDPWPTSQGTCASTLRMSCSDWPPFQTCLCWPFWGSLLVPQGTSLKTSTVPENWGSQFWSHHLPSVCHVAGFVLAQFPVGKWNSRDPDEHIHLRRHGGKRRMYWSFLFFGFFLMWFFFIQCSN